MEVIADLQVHSKYARAVSKYANLTYLDLWGRKKGIGLLGTGDFQHPEYFKEIKSSLVEVQKGIFKLREELVDYEYEMEDKFERHVDFMLQSEISSIYKQGGKARRVHNLIFSPSIKTAEKIIAELQKRGANLTADGRPIVGLSSKDLLDLLLNIDENAMLIPAHVWTPWFGLYGSKSGFDSIEECFGDLSKYIYAIETGLSSDPRMNWQIKELENRSILSFSDAHSGQKLGREATVFMPNTLVRHPVSKHVFEYDYFDIMKAIKQDPTSKLEVGYTIEFFPEEGKYHWSGHRAHDVKMDALQVKRNGEICPVCGKKMTIGVENRVLDLSDKIITEDDLNIVKSVGNLKYVYNKNEMRAPFASLIPLQEILFEVSKSKAAAIRDYEFLVSKSSEFEILLNQTYSELEKLFGSRLALAIRKVRERDIHIDPGYDGLFGKIKIFN